jgi:hypothetical protein
MEKMHHIEDAAKATKLTMDEALSRARTGGDGVGEAAMPDGSQTQSEDGGDTQEDVSSEAGVAVRPLSQTVIDELNEAALDAFMTISRIAETLYSHVRELSDLINDVRVTTQVLKQAQVLRRKAKAQVGEVLSLDASRRVVPDPHAPEHWAVYFSGRSEKARVDLAIGVVSTATSYMLSWLYWADVLDDVFGFIETGSAPEQRSTDALFQSWEDQVIESRRRDDHFFSAARAGD